MLVLKQATEKSPLITIDGNILTISGRSFMENSRDFYKSFFAEVKDLNFDDLLVVIDIEYINSNSSKWLLEFCYFLAEKKSKGAKTRVVWKYGEKNFEMKEIGEDFKLSLGRLIPIDIVEDPDDD